MRSHVVVITLAILVACIIPSGLHAQNRIMLNADNGANIDVYLMIVGPGPAIYSWWGHIGLVLVNQASGAEYLYDYGNFDFAAENFYRNFALGRLWFSMYRFPFAAYVEHTKSQDRSLRIHQLDLNPAQKLELLEFLETNFLPENRPYLYHHYNDNCSTRIRDILDRLTDHKISASVAEASEATLRQLSRRYADHSAGGYWLINFLLAGSNDRPIGGWEELFIPDFMEKAVQTAGLTLNSLTLISSDTYPLPGEPDIARYHGKIYGLLLLILLPALLFFILKRQRLFQFYRALVLLAAGIPGSVLFFMMFFSDHDVTYGNWNILLASPLLLIAIPVYLKRGRSIQAQARLRLICSSVLCGLGVLGLLLARIPIWYQDNVSVALNFLFMYAFFGTIDLIMFRRAE